jgi:phthalate 4,5-dioxygenase oxygenase subunit
MLNAADNERLTRVGPGTPMGQLFRSYWIPALLSEELPAVDGAPVRVRLLGEDLVAFRDSDGGVGLIDAYCPHRRAPLFFGRNEECGLRCVYHGWKFDRNGACVDMPSEPPDSLFKSKVAIAAYPTWEGGGIVWTYMGDPARKPALPDHELCRAPVSHRGISKTFEDCNYLQGLEGGLDPTHATILHNPAVGDLSFLAKRHSTVAKIEVDETDYGIFYVGLRDAGEQRWVRGYHYIMPSYHMRGQVDATFWLHQKKSPTIDGHIWVPIDDHTTWIYNFLYSYDPNQPITATQFDDDETWQGRGPNDMARPFFPRRNRSNDYGIDRSVQKQQTMTGIDGVNTQDFAVQEGMGAICDRSQEHLGSSDKIIIMLRKMLLDSLDRMERGEPLRAADPASYRNLRAIDRKIAKDVPWREQVQADLVARF